MLLSTEQSYQVHRRVLTALIVFITELLLPRYPFCHTSHIVLKKLQNEFPPRKLAQTVTFLISIRVVPASNLGRDAYYHDPYFLQHIQASARIVPFVHDHFLPHPFHYYHPIIRHHTV
jgi:hypothetical protein